MAPVVNRDADPLWGGGADPLLLLRMVRGRADLVCRRFQSVTALYTYRGSVLLPPRRLGGAPLGTLIPAESNARGSGLGVLSQSVPGSGEEQHRIVGSSWGAAAVGEEHASNQANRVRGDVRPMHATKSLGGALV